MKVLLVDERFFDLNILQNFILKGACSLLDIDKLITGTETSTLSSTNIAETKLSEPVFSKEPSTFPKTQQQLLLDQVREYIDSHYMEFDLSLTSAAKFIHMSPSHLSIIFKKEIGMTFISYLTDLRIKRAKQLLSSTDLMVYEISSSVGYENYAYFSTVFKKNVGLSPKEYRNTQKLQD